MVTKVIPFNPGAGAAAGGAALGAQVFGWVLLGLGLIVTTAQAIDLMNQYTEFSGELETSIYYYPDGSWSYGVDMGFVERVRAFLWDNGVFELSVPIPDSADVSNYDGLAAAVDAFRNYPYALVVYHDSVQWTVCGSDVPCSFSKTSDGNYYVFKTEDRSNSIRFTKTYSAGETSHLDWNVVTVTSFCRFGTANSTDTDFDIVSDYELGQVAPLTVPMPESYPEWNTNARPATNPDTDEEITVLPIPLNPSADPETQIGTLTQPDIWQGALADPMPDTDTNPDTGTDTDSDTQPDSPGAPSTDIGKFQIDLKDFFPFCIPFDLYRFFEILCAEPEAPVFHWEFNVFGEIYSLDVDLSPWNPHAQLFRDAQVGLFIMGLLWITRKFIKW